MLSLKFPLPLESVPGPVRVLLPEVYEAVRDFRYGSEGFDGRRADVITRSLRIHAVARRHGRVREAAIVSACGIRWSSSAVIQVHRFCPIQGRQQAVSLL